MSKLKKEATVKSIFHLLYNGKIYSQCPFCFKYLTLFEAYNENCSECGKVEFSKIILIDFSNEESEE